MKKTFWNKRMPTILSIGLIIIAIVITSLLVKTNTVFVSRADITQTPQNVKITNISDTGFTLSYTTDVENIASVNFAKDKNLGQTALDDRDQTGLIRPHKIHNFTLRNLKPNTRYFFAIISGQNTFLNNNIPYETTTAPKTQFTQAKSPPITGKIVLPDGEAPKEALVYAKIDKAQEISSLSKNNGIYSLSLNSLLLEDLSFPLTIDPNDIIKMIVTNGSLKSTVLLSGAKINAIPIITLSHDYDFTQKTETTSSRSSTLSGFPSIPKPSVSLEKNPGILVPKKDQTFTNQQPVFHGTAMPNAKVKIIIRSSSEIEKEVTADSFGNWSFAPAQTLSPGEHTISIQTKNKSGILQNITQSFIVLAAINPTLPPTPTATLVPTITLPSMVPTPTFAPPPTAIITRAPTIIPTQTPIIVVSPTISPRTPLGNPSILIIGIMGLSILALGYLLFLKT